MLAVQWLMVGGQGHERERKRPGEKGNIANPKYKTHCPVCASAACNTTRVHKTAPLTYVFRFDVDGQLDMCIIDIAET